MNANRRNALLTIGVGIVLWFLPIPDGVTPLAWHLLAVFVATVLGFILHPLPIGAVAFIAISFSVWAGLLKTSDALAGYGNSTIWLIVCAFLYPIVRSLAEALGSKPGESARRIGTYLMQVGYHTDAVTCTMFVTSMAGNPLCVALAEKTLGVHVTWMGWASAAIVPGLIALLLVPYVMMKLSPPELVRIPDAKGLAQRELSEMGPMSLAEKGLSVIFVASLALWASSGLTGIDATPVAMGAVCLMLMLDIINWQDVIKEKGAWDAMFWMGSLMTLASALAKSGIITWIANGAGAAISSLGFDWVISCLIILLFYTYIHYAFASVTARISALYAAFIAVSVTVGAPPLLVAIVFGIFADVPISLTHYGNGCAPIYFGGDYVSQGEWWKNGFIMTTITTLIYLTIGAAWWKVLGLW